MIFGLLPLLVLALLISGIVLLVLKKAKHFARILILLGAFLPAFLGWLFAGLLLMGEVHQDFYFCIIGIALVLLLILLGLALWGQLKKKRFTIPVVSLLAGCLAVTLICNSIWAYHDRIPTLTESEDLLARYAPLSTNKNLATPDQPPTLKLEQYPRLDGATALYPIYSAVAVAVYPENVAKDTECSTTTGAYERIIEGTADLIFAAAPSEEQQIRAEQEGVELVLTPIGREAFVFFVNSKNPLENITTAQIKSIYAGETTHWDELGVKKLGKIRAFQRDEGSGSQSTLQRLMGDTPLMTPPKEDVVAGMGGIIRKTADYKNYANAIGYSFRFYSTEMVQNDQIKLLSVNGVAPTIENIENGSYPLASEFYAVTRSDASESTKQLVEWMVGPQGQELIEKTGYTKLNG
ncbi:MAG: substrate-binding domain-containing protein [Clostridia bacterium]|nr:substrate-binding domain-containing protein [Clostridia bacterium]